MNQAAPQSRSAVETLCHEVRGTIAPLANWRRLLHSQAIKPEDLGALANVLDRTVLVLSRLASDLARLQSTAQSEASSDFRKRASLTKAAGRPALPAEVNRRRRA